MIYIADGQLVLTSAGLLSKYGFNDGDEPDELVDYLDEHLPEYDYVTDRAWKPVLRRLVRERLAPLLHEDVELVDVETSHNPIRVWRVGGEEIADHWMRTDRPELLTPVSVSVPLVDVVALMREEIARPDQHDGRSETA